MTKNKHTSIKQVTLLGLSLVMLAFTGRAQQAIKGSVTFADSGNPAGQGQAVLLSYQGLHDLAPMMHMVQISPKGEFEFSNLQPGLYKLVTEPIRAQLNQYQVAYYPNKLSRDSSDFVWLQPNETPLINLQIAVKEVDPVFGSKPTTSTPPKGAAAGDPIPGVDVSLEQITGGLYKGPKLRREKKTEAPKAPEYEAYSIQSRICVKYTDERLQEMSFMYYNDSGELVGTLYSSVSDLLPGSTLASYPLPPGEYRVRTELEPEGTGQVVRIR